MAQPSLDKPKTQLCRHACETANHHLNRSSATAKNSTFGGSKTAPLESLRTRKEAQYVETPYKKKKRALWRNLAWTSRKRSFSAMHAKQPNTTEIRAQPQQKTVHWTSRKRSFSAMHAKQPNTTEIRAQPQQKTVHSAGPKRHLWNP